jgi:broad specificity phosphatase PhoE
MPTPSQIFLFRHGQTDWNAQGRFQGHMDIPLNTTGRAQARDLAEKLQDADLEAILTSDLSRAQETADIVAALLAIPVVTDPGLREAFLGEAQGMTYDEIRAQFGEDLTSRWRSDHPTDADVSYPGGETAAAVVLRSFAAMERFLKSGTYSRIGVSTHGGVIRRVMQSLRPPGSPPVLIPNAVVYRIEWDEGRWKILE